MCGEIALEGYHTATTYGRLNLQQGGIAIFSRDDDFTAPNRINCLSVELHCEVSAVRLNSHNMTILCFYRSLKEDFKLFLDTSERVFCSLGISCNVMLCGDFNVRFNVGDRKAESLCDLI
ncbi:hypothetical protein HHI36_011627 [Cryptolaemus montrouzieri]|uniref:Endonuclease/exonuclease/phosphatase domain-containing protein n=1 Tax=Cryptolaemus montrouzieri TaxID=559131 RepID=A0ABD2MM69_9CUCU